MSMPVSLVHSLVCVQHPDLTDGCGCGGSNGAGLVDGVDVDR